MKDCTHFHGSRQFFSWAQENTCKRYWFKIYSIFWLPCVLNPEKMTSCDIFSILVLFKRAGQTSDFGISQEISILLSSFSFMGSFLSTGTIVYICACKSLTNGYNSVFCRHQVYYVIPYNEAQSKMASRENNVLSDIMTQQEMGLIVGLLLGLCISWFLLLLDRVWFSGLNYWRANQMHGE